ncbi:MAG TPA: hypothetical protein VG454_00385, partial [Gemmatimonadales bacterium]|nr:hypothetical protein [Gemmatimonadales bacterium]
MRRMIVPSLLALATALVSPLDAQWRTELGIQTGYTRLVSAGSGADPTDAFSLPGFNLGNVLPSSAGLYFIIPWSPKFAVETDFGASQFSSGLTVTFLSVGLRGDYALTRNLYAAAGGALAYNNGLANETQLGVQGAVGYRFRLNRALGARFEGRTTFFGKASNAPPADVYSLLFGLSTVTSHSGTAHSSGATSTRSDRAWRTELGIAGGYADAHLIGTGSIVALSFPGYGGALGNALGSVASIFRAVALPPTVFAILPLSEKVALEPALDIHRFQTDGQTDFSGNLSVRFDYALHGSWYGGLGGNLHYIKSTGVNAATRT